ncbi:MAG: flagellar biosynthesis protein FlhA [Piscirickettsiaceae bacterium CG_4_9_14_3_um_filter_43_564]|nr:flagellar biosynthesis protein FlhA [Thiomicrospira sp.]OIP94984.1 MAG: flagellar biosynthesis protein FlhA [Thiomicrospira sp. CG2_30_44_34]PIQ04953.1 MAG: flagellar biosynthesis protein FlhA [Piscirickettsiaceae bacterium CG18_big_fil_WC_8_21_14_2_50_44_103]PIU38228.1 MAG: flagellar biosynthesis protein FlhA [Piscirickettsiaceae bacterium CG07_land_8_20_14_0_80_44_28]PIW57321.1 MAG: flagellar biosynthesis protein FlhA [Piscirickettsiaceae bacterium CG12_big_fil_rev_8_21_14_0_65_44_934]PIW
MDFNQLLSQIQHSMKSGIGIPIAILALLAMVVVPLPPFLLDVFFTFNIALSLVVLMVSLYAKRPLDFAVFPTIILLTTLFRLALNIASTRVILLEGHTGPAAAGNVIEAFGAFVIGGNFAVGLVVFAILVVINFVVITKGAGRVAEVSARFTLDSMPGKQMAIDADLNAGLITQEQAQARRIDVTSEADFYGSMDGASKFVRGDAVAGIVILFINLIGGFAIGMGQHDLSFSDAIEVYTLLTLGDGLVAQIPSLLLSTATAIIVTRVSGDKEDMAQQVQTQMFTNPKALGMTAVIVGVFGVIPGMPNLAFLTFSGIAGAGAYLIHRKSQQKPAAEAALSEATEETEEKSPELSWDDVQNVDILGLEVGYRLIPMVDQAQSGQLLERVKGVRRKVSQELGFLVPPVHIRDNLDLKPNQYRIMLMGVISGEGEVFPDKELAINPGQVFGDIAGVPTQDPTFGLDAVWIVPSDREQAQALGYTVVDSSTVVATHISQVIQDYAAELLGHDEAQTLLDKIKQTSPKLVEELVPDKMTLAVVVKVLQNLLTEKVSIRDLRTILETLTEKVAVTQNAADLTMYVRAALGRSIIQGIVSADEDLKVITLEPGLEQLLLQATQGSPEGQLAIEPSLAERLHTTLKAEAQKLEMDGQAPVLLVAPQIRAQLARLFRFSLSNLHVLAYSEVPENRQISVVANVGQGG